MVDLLFLVSEDVSPNERHNSRCGPGRWFGKLCSTLPCLLQSLPTHSACPESVPTAGDPAFTSPPPPAGWEAPTFPSPSPCAQLSRRKAENPSGLVARPPWRSLPQMQTNKPRHPLQCQRNASRLHLGTMNPNCFGRFKPFLGGDTEAGRRLATRANGTEAQAAASPGPYILRRLLPLPPSV